MPPKNKKKSAWNFEFICLNGCIFLDNGAMKMEEEIKNDNL